MSKFITASEARKNCEKFHASKKFANDCCETLDHAILVRSQKGMTSAFITFKKDDYYVEEVLRVIKENYEPDGFKISSLGTVKNIKTEEEIINIVISW